MHHVRPKTRVAAIDSAMASSASAASARATGVALSDAMHAPALMQGNGARELRVIDNDPLDGRGPAF